MAPATRKVFDALCVHVKAEGTGATLTRVELQGATGLTEEKLMGVLRELVGPENDQDLEIRFVDGNPDKITLGPRWSQDCGVK